MLYRISSVVLPAGGIATFGDIPQTYQHLKIHYWSTGTSTLNMYFNNDTTAGNYWYRNWEGGYLPFGVGGANNANYVYQNSAGTPQCLESIILDYSNSNKYKTTKTVYSGVSVTAANGTMDLYSHHWKNTGAITKLDIYTPNSSSRVDLYGIL